MWLSLLLSFTLIRIGTLPLRTFLHQLCKISERPQSGQSLPLAISDNFAPQIPRDKKPMDSAGYTSNVSLMLGFRTDRESRSRCPLYSTAQKKRNKTAAGGIQRNCPPPGFPTDNFLQMYSSQYLLCLQNIAVKMEVVVTIWFLLQRHMDTLGTVTQVASQQCTPSDSQSPPTLGLYKRKQKAKITYGLCLLLTHSKCFSCRQYLWLRIGLR